MPEINQPTPIKPIWPTRREENPKRRRPAPEVEEEGSRESGGSDKGKGQQEGGKGGPRIDEYA